MRNPEIGLLDCVRTKRRGPCVGLGNIFPTEQLTTVFRQAKGGFWYTDVTNAPMKSIPDAPDFKTASGGSVPGGASTDGNNSAIA